MKAIRKEYESQFKKTERGLIHYSEWLENKVEEYSQLQTRALIEKYEKKKEDLIDKIKGGASKKERVSIDTEVVDYMRFIAELKNIKL